MVLLLLGVLYSISDTVSQFLYIVKFEINLAMLFAIVPTVLFYGYTYINRDVIRYISSSPDNSFSNFTEMRNQVQKLENLESLAKYRMPTLLFFGVLMGFFVSYFIGGNDWQIVLKLPITILTSVGMASVVVSFVGIVIEIILLGLRYLIWLKNSS